VNLRNLLTYLPAWRPLAAMIAISLIAFAAPTEAREPTSSEVLELNNLASDPARSAEAIARARGLLASNLDETYIAYARQMLLQAMIRGGGSTAEIVAATDTLDQFLGQDPRARMMWLGNVSQVLIERREAIDRAVAFARSARAACPEGQAYDQVRALCEAMLGRALLEHGDADGAVASLLRAVPAAPESQVVLFHLGRAHQQRGEDELAIGAYLRSLGVFPGKDTSAAAPLRTLYRKKHGGLGGLTERVQVARKASRERVALGANRYERAAPYWELPDFAGKKTRLTDFAGRVVVIDFWGSWCGPCRAELPYFQALYDKFKNRGVAFVGINWERGSTPEARIEAAQRLMVESKYTFPVVVDHDYRASKDHSVQSFPTVFVIDKTGKIRYRNVGFDPAIDVKLEAQIESLME
jgi:thiol-disulfide isomerase/thioredoxin